MNGQNKEGPVPSRFPVPPKDVPFVFLLSDPDSVWDRGFYWVEGRLGSRYQAWFLPTKAIHG